MICTCTHRNCYFTFQMKGTAVPERCPDCGNRSVRAASAEEIAWFRDEHPEFSSPHIRSGRPCDRRTA